MPAERSVLILIDSFDMGGSEAQAVQLARLLVEKKRFPVHLACLRREGVLLREAERLRLGDVPEFPLTSFYDRNMFVQLRRFAGFLRSRRVGILHARSFYTNVFGILGAALAGVPVRIGYRGETGGWRTPAQDAVERAVFRLARVVHANSEAVRQHLIKTGVPARKVVTLYNGLDVARVTPPPDFRRDEAAAAFGLPREGGRRFVTIMANMRHEVKDHPTFLRAARRVLDAVPEASFVLAGEGDLADQLRALAKQLGLEGRVFFTGRCERVAELLALSEVCVLSSKAEGFSNAILEYMAAARPVVATDVGGAREAVAHGETGYLVPPGDDQGLASHIVSLLKEPGRAREMGARGRAVVERKFSAQAQLENTEALYSRLLAETASAHRRGTAAGAASEGVG